VDRGGAVKQYAGRLPELIQELSTDSVVNIDDLKKQSSRLDPAKETESVVNEFAAQYNRRLDLPLYEWDLPIAPQAIQQGDWGA
jgi:hypothetical protein